MAESTPGVVRLRGAAEEQRIMEELWKRGGGGDNSGGMESRIAKLEAQVEQLRVDTGDIRKSVGELKVQGATIVENLRHLPTKPWIFSVCLGLLAAIGGIVALIVRFLPHAG